MTIAEKLSNNMNNTATWMAIAMGFALPISTAASNIFLGLTLFFFALSGNYYRKFQSLVRNPVALMILAFVALTALGGLYGQGDITDKKFYFGKYASLLAAPLLMPLFSSARHRLYALIAFSLAMLLTLVLSYALRFGWVPSATGFLADRALTGTSNPVVFKLSITHGFLMAISAFMFALGAQYAQLFFWRRTFIILAILAGVNVLFMVIGRTGYLVLVALATYLFYCRFGKKGLTLALFFSLAIGTLAYQLSDTFYDRTRTAIAEAQAWKPKAGDKSSIGLRLDYYSNTLAIIKDHPWFGVGVGGFEVAYSAKIKGTQMAPSNNPHNQYLLTSAQFGLLGMVALISLFATLLWQARYLAPPYRQIAYGVLFAFLIGNTFNSFMLDFTERLFFAWICGVLFSGLPERKTLDKHHRT